jgi:hypothetical protein
MSARRSIEGNRQATTKDSFLLTAESYVLSGSCWSANTDLIVLIS